MDPHWAWRDPGREAEVVVPADPDHVMEALMLRTLTAGAAGAAGAGRWHGRCPGRPAAAAAHTAAAEWPAGWAKAEALAQKAIDRALAHHDEATEPGVARALFAWAPPGSTIVASSSMPVRDLEWFAAPRPDPPRVLANRGANGIDGVVSTTLGVAAASAGTGGPVVGLLGDLAFLHDSASLVRGRREPTVPAVFVVLDNGGGGIFSFLPQASELDEASFERLFGTPQKVDVADLARAAGCDVIEIASVHEVPIRLDEALGHAGKARSDRRRRAHGPEGKRGPPHRARGRDRARPRVTRDGTAARRRPVCRGTL